MKYFFHINNQLFHNEILFHTKLTCNFYPYPQSLLGNFMTIKFNFFYLTNTTTQSQISSDSCAFQIIAIKDFQNYTLALTNPLLGRLLQPLLKETNLMGRRPIVKAKNYKKWFEISIKSGIAQHVFYFRIRPQQMSYFKGIWKR